MAAMDAWRTMNSPLKQVSLVPTTAIEQRQRSSETRKMEDEALGYGHLRRQNQAPKI